MLSKLRFSFVKVLGFLFILSSVSVVSIAEVSEAGLSADVNSLSAEVDDLARDISRLERELLFPPLTRVQVYLSLSTDVQFTPRTMSLSIDGEEKSFHIYSDSDVAALRLGGLQRFWEGNVSMGEHVLGAVIKGEDRKGRELEEQVQFRFEKENTGHSIEVKINAQGKSKKPAFSVKDWGEN